MSPALGGPVPPPRTRAVLASLLTLLVLLMATAAVWVSISDTASEDARREFDDQANQAGRAVENEIRQYTDRLRDVGIFATNSQAPPADAFASYVHDSQLFDQLPAIVGVLFVSRVPDAELETFLTEVRRNRPDFTVLQIAAPDGDIRYPLTYYEPGRVDLGLPIGTDISSLDAVTDLMITSAVTGDSIAGSFQQDPFLQEIANQNDFPTIDALLTLDFFIGVPVYPPGTPVAGPPNQPVGWIAATIADFDDVAMGTTVAVPDGLGMELTVELDDVGMGDRSDLSRVAQVHSDVMPRDEAAFERSIAISVEGIDWTLDVWSSADADAPTTAAGIALAAGIGGSALAAGLVYGRMRARDRGRAYAADIAQREQFQRAILDSVTDPMVVVDPDGVIVRANPAWGDLWSTTSAGQPGLASWVGATYLDVLRGAVVDGHHELTAAVLGVLRGNLETTDVDLALAADDRTVGAATAPEPAGATDTITIGPASPTWLAVRVTPLRGRRPGAIVIHTDVTDQKRSQVRLEAQASRDPLTGLANRTTFTDELERALVPTRHTDHRLAVLFIDLDGFKPVNDSYGHSVGDDVLRAVGRRIDAVVRSTDTAARLGGDEFVVLIDPLPHPSVAEATAQRILAAMATPIHSHDHEIALGASIGVAVVEGPSTLSAATLLERADTAMYSSKQRGGGRTTVVAN